MKSLHITNGDGAAKIIETSAIAGDVLPWRDPMHHGPFPAELNLDQVSRVRAQYLADPSMDVATVHREFQQRDAQLRTAQTYDEVVLWFEHDLLDQLQILQILDWFAGRDIGSTRLKMVCINQFEGIAQFRGIGQLDALQMATLYLQRKSVARETCEIAKRGWAAFRSEDPRDLLAFAYMDLHALPFLQAAILRHFEEFPNAKTGLTRTEWQLLTLLKDAPRDPVELFIKNMDFETVLYIGDWPTYRHLSFLCKAGLVSCEPHSFWHPPTTTEAQQSFQKQRLSLTDLGAQILDGAISSFDFIHRDIWLGGVHVCSDQPLWLWDEEARQLVR